MAVFVLSDGLHFLAGEHAENVFKQKAIDDLQAFLKYRAAEIMPGGLLLLITPGTLGSQCSYASLYDAFAEAGRQLVEEGRVDRYLFQEFVMPVYFFTAQVSQHSHVQRVKRGQLSATIL